MPIFGRDPLLTGLHRAGEHGFHSARVGQRSLERSGGAVERLRQMLFDLGLKFECQERRNRMRELESGLFVVADEVGCRWSGGPTSTRVRS
jgi:hypothetical protein